MNRERYGLEIPCEYHFYVHSRKIWIEYITSTWTEKSYLLTCTLNSEGWCNKINNFDRSANKDLVIYCFMFAVLYFSDGLIKFQDNEKLNLRLWKKWLRPLSSGDRSTKITLIWDFVTWPFNKAWPINTEPLNTSSTL